MTIAELPAQFKSGVRAIEEYCAGIVPPHLADEIRIEVVAARRAVTIIERRPLWRGRIDDEWSGQPIARFRLEPAGAWSLWWYRRERWLRHDVRPESRACSLAWRAARSVTSDSPARSSANLRSGCGGGLVLMG